MADKVIKALLIEDDLEDTLLLAKLMAQPGSCSFRFVLECAEDLEAGLATLGRGEAEVVLLDLNLPDSSGIETVRAVRERFPDIPIVVLTGMRDELLGLEAVSHGAQDYQVKGSLDGHSLRRTISYAVERHRTLVSLKNIIRGAADGMVVVDAKGLVRHMNPAAEAIFGCAAEGMLGRGFPYPLSADRSGELRVPGGGSGERILEMRVSAVEWEDAPASLASLRDITELRRIEQLKAEVKERERMDKLKDDLMGVVSHEMLNPLTIIKAATCNLKEELAGSLSQQQAEMVSLQHKHILRLERILEKILDLARLESGRARLDIQAVDARRLIRETLRAQRLVASGRGVVIAEELTQGLPQVSADPELFIQVLSNLVDNAMRFAKSSIVVRAQAEEVPAADGDSGRAPGLPGVLPGSATRCVRVSVIDDGEGIPHDRFKELFSKFIQVHRKGEGEGYRGTGLGLAICKEIVERLGGSIWAESPGGRGASFHFSLPQCERVPDAQGGAHGPR